MLKGSYLPSFPQAIGYQLAARDHVFEHQNYEAMILGPKSRPITSKKAEEMVREYQVTAEVVIGREVITTLLARGLYENSEPPAALQPNEFAVVGWYNRTLLEEVNTWRNPDDRVKDKLIVMPHLTVNSRPVLCRVHFRHHGFEPLDPSERTHHTYAVLGKFSYSLEFAEPAARIYTYPTP